MEQNFSTYAQQYKDALFEDLIPFWLQHSIDEQHGGYFSCLTRNGQVYDTDKFVCLQAHQMWSFSMLYRLAGKNEAWREVATHGARFLQKHGRNKDQHWFFALTREGAPLIQPYDIFTDFFAAMAFSEYARAMQDDEARVLAVMTYDNILERRLNPSGKYNQLYPGTRPLKNFALPKTLCNLTLEMQDILDPVVVERSLDICLHEVLDVFLDKEKNIIYENVFPDGRHHDSIKGRLINPGNGIEAMWFAMELGVRRQDKALMETATQVVLDTLEFSWDKEYGGIFHWLDAKGLPLQHPDWNHKVWWIHLEALISLTRGYILTRNQACLPWIKRVHEYTWSHFPDHQYGEWFGYLNRQGDVQSDQKGGQLKGFFHLPRAVFKCWKNFEQMSHTYYD